MSKKIALATLSAILSAALGIDALAKDNAGQNANVEKCLVGVMQRIVFPEPLGGGIVERFWFGAQEFREVRYQRHRC